MTKRVPVARFRGELMLGDTPLDCYVLNTGERVISLRAAVKAIAERDHGRLGDYVGIVALKPVIDSNLVLGESCVFEIPGTQFPGKGITAERFVDICNAYVNALHAGALATERQRQIAVRCAIVVAASAKLGIVSLVDEATGYQYVRKENALQLKLRAFIADEMREWEKEFPDDLWMELGRLTNWQGSLHHRPKWWGKLVMELIYYALDPDVACHLKENKPAPTKGQNYHQWFTENFGIQQLRSHIHQIIGIAKTCDSLAELREIVAETYGRDGPQLRLLSARQVYRPRNSD